VIFRPLAKIFHCPYSAPAVAVRKGAPSSFPSRFLCSPFTVVLSTPVRSGGFEAEPSKVVLGFRRRRQTFFPVRDPSRLPFQLFAVLIRLAYLLLPLFGDRAPFHFRGVFPFPSLTPLLPAIPPPRPSATFFFPLPRPSSRGSPVDLRSLLFSAPPGVPLPDLEL